MCLILFSYQMHTDYWLILAANRDEFYNRPAAPLDYWAEHPDLGYPNRTHRCGDQL